MDLTQLGFVLGLDNVAVALHWAARTGARRTMLLAALLALPARR